MFRHRAIAILLCLAFRTATPVPAEDGATPLTDPEALTRMGFPADARNVYLAKGVAPDVVSRASAPEEFGTVGSGWTTVPGNHHEAREQSEYGTLNGGGDIFLLSGGTFFDALLEMPSGAIVQEVRWWGVDEAAQALTIFFFSVCQPDTSGTDATLTVLGNGASAGTPGEFSIALVPTEQTVVDNRSCFYFARSSLHAGAGPSLVLRKVRAQWLRQVSPAPGTATFDDVPTGHPFFRFVEALAASGITAGCGGGDFCPDTPLTRGQMAVFLSAALGLHWPN